MISAYFIYFSVQTGGLYTFRTGVGKRSCGQCTFFSALHLLEKKFKRQFTAIGDDTNEALIEVMGAKVGDELAEH